MKILLTGGAGFIGSHIAEALLEANYEVIIVDNLITGNEENIPSGAKFYNRDICLSIDDIFVLEKPDYVIHQAAQVSVGKSLESPIDDAQINILATINLLDACVKYKIKKFIFASTAAVYGNPLYLPIDESHPTKPISFYGLSKCTSELYIKLYSELFALPYSILRYANVYGPRQNANGEAGVIAIFAEKIINAKTLRIYGDGLQTRDFIFVKDVAKANVAALNRENNEIVNISTNVQTSLLTLFFEFKNIMKNNSLLPVFCDPKFGDINNSLLSNDKAKNLLHWRPIHNISTGLKETILYYKNTIKHNG
ncbi:NAD-dependent epimerase/dehydratase family protein [Paenisporosarcina quisquiliarum]|uniref:NAD-dependent epimerase/dehydratase family protein n=1 Tax=Paenisporosarcina quisquiliarum TaxID=365346 RepID=UPI003736013C